MPPLPASVFSSALPLSGHSIDSSISGSDKAAGGPAGPPTNIEWTDKEPPARRQPQTSASPDQLHHQISTSNPHIKKHLRGQASAFEQSVWVVTGLSCWPVAYRRAGRMRREEGGRPPDQYIVSNINPRPARPPLHIQPPHPPALAPCCAPHVLMQKGGGPGGPWQAGELISSWDVSGHTGRARARRTTNTNVAKPPPNLSLTVANESYFFAWAAGPTPPLFDSGANSV